MGVSVLGDNDGIGAGSDETIFNNGDVVGIAELETGDAESSETSMRLTTSPAMSTVTLDSKPQSVSSVS